ncbi:MAG: HYR domain-containing protein, partial [Bacteroidia bacterium]|nr:HYR domain-containing protein [Bacteroidia bacterium]
PGTQTLTLTPNCAGTLPDYTTLATVAPGCAGPMTVTQSPVAGTTVTGSGLMTITLTATDASNITATCSFTVNKVDINPPTIVCPANQTLPLSANCSVTLPDYTLQATASDVCPGAVVITQSPAAGTILSGQGATTVTLTATDAGNNTATCSFTVNRVDTSPPSLNCPATQSLVLSPNCAAVLPDYTLTVSATDACTGAAAVTQSPAPGTAYSGIGSMTVTLTATDGNNNSTSCSFTVNRVDNIAPLLTCPSNQTLSLGASCSAVLPDYTGMSAATDNCGAVTLTQTPAAGTSVSGSGAITVTVTATDLDNNITTCTFTVTKTDNTAPVPNVATLPAINGECSVSVNAPAATDDCSGTVTATTNDPLIYTSPGTYTVNWTYSDLSGNVSTQTQTVTVSPVSVNASSNSPVCIGASVNLSASSLSNGTYQWVGPNNFSSNQQNPLVSNPANGNYIVSFTSSLNPNCNVTDTVAVTISPLPTPVITQNGTLLSTGTYLTYQWFKNGFAINGATFQTHNATSNGLYSVQVTDQNGCTATSSLINVTNVSITPIINDRLSVYPNPVKDQVSIVLTDLKPNTFAKLYNALGQTLMTIPLSTEKSDVGLQTLAKGVYTLEVWENGDRTGIIQLIKE